MLYSIDVFIVISVSVFRSWSKQLPKHSFCINVFSTVGLIVVHNYCSLKSEDLYEKYLSMTCLYDSLYPCIYLQLLRQTGLRINMILVHYVSLISVATLLITRVNSLDARNNDWICNVKNNRPKVSVKCVIKMILLYLRIEGRYIKANNNYNDGISWRHVSLSSLPTWN